MNYYDDPMNARAALDFLACASREGRPEEFNPCTKMSRRFGNLVTVLGLSLRVAYYRVHQHPSGQEYVRLLVDPSEDEQLRLVQGG